MEEKQVEVQMDRLALSVNDNDSSSDSSVPPAAQLTPLSLTSPSSMTSEYPDEEESTQESSLLREWKSVQLTEEGPLSPPKKKEQKMTDMLRKGAVAVTGGVLVVAGIPLIPCPTPGGVVVVGSGMALLATEFPAAQRALDKSREGLANMVQESDDEAEEGEKNKTKSKKGGTYLAIAADTDDAGEGCESDSEVVSPNSKRRQGVKYGRLGNGTSTKQLENRMKADLDQAMRNVKQGRRNVKRFVRNNVLPIVSKVTTKKDSGKIME